MFGVLSQGGEEVELELWVQVEFWLVDEDVRRLRNSSVDKNEDELCQPRTVLVEPVWPIVYIHLERVVIVVCVDFESVVPEQPFDVCTDLLADHLFPKAVPRLHLTPTLDKG